MKASTEVRTVTTREAQHHLTRVLAMVEKGEEVIITRRGKPVARVSNIEEEEDPLERKVDWSESIKRRDEMLKDLPVLQGNLIEELRKDERY